MPRLSREEFFARRARLHTDWREGGHLLRHLNAEQQWALHDFYLLSHDLPDTEVLARRNVATKIQPMLAKTAGLAYRSFAMLEAQAHKRAGAAISSQQEEHQFAPTPRRRRRSGRLIAWSDPNHPTDMRLLAETLVRLAKEQAARDGILAADDSPDAPTPPENLPGRERQA